MHLLTFGPIKGTCFLVSHIEGSARIVYMRQHQRIFALEGGRFWGCTVMFGTKISKCKSKTVNLWEYLYHSISIRSIEK